MTPQELARTLLLKSEEQGQQLLQTYVPVFSGPECDRLVYYIKKEADQQWTNNGALSFLLSGHLLFIATLTRNRYYHALALMSRGDALHRMERDQDAIPFFDAAGEEFLAIGEEIEWARTRIGRINACINLSRTTEALRDATRAHDIFMRHNKLLRAAQVDANAAVIHYELGQYDQAQRLLDRAIETYQRHGEGVDLHIARARGNKALALASQGKFREAEVLHNQALATFSTYGNPQEISVAREELNIAAIYAAQGHFSRALLLFNRSRDLFKKHGIDSSEKEVAQQICHCLVRLNRAREAYELAGETANFFRAHGQSDRLARSLMQQAMAATLEGKFHEAEEMLREASMLLEEFGLMGQASEARLQRAELYFADGQLQASLREAQHVADYYAEREDLPQLARATLLLARIADANGDAVSAYDLCHHALDIARNQELLDLQYPCDDLLGQLAERRGNLEEAAFYYDRAVQGIDEVQSRLVLDARTSFLEDKGSMYQRAIILALRLGNIHQALIYIEKAKSRALGDYLRNNIDIRMRAGDEAGEAILKELERLREEQAWYSSIVYETWNEADLSDTAIIRIRSTEPLHARQEMQQRERQIEKLLEQIQLRSAGDLVARQRTTWTQALISSLCSNLDRSSLLLEYYLTEQDLYIFQLTRDRVDVQVVPGAVPRLERLLSLWRANLDLAAQAAGASDRAQAFFGLQENGLGLLQRLYDLLLAPIAPSLHLCKHLVIVPYGILHYLPFHCLFDGVQFVIEQLDVSYLPAASLLDLCRQRGQRIAARDQHGEALVLGLSDNGRLAYAVQEAQAVAQQLGVVPALDADASTTLLSEVGIHSSLLHIAAHGLFRLDAPNFSHIKLADRQLDAIELFNLDFSACSLVTLSACETGRAVVRGVDEVIGLGRGFLYAGAASLLPTFWKIDDASSAELMQQFYASLVAGSSKTAALANAQREFIESARTSVRPYRVHPYFWAAFHLIGDYGTL